MDYVAIDISRLRWGSKRTRGSTTHYKCSYGACEAQFQTPRITVTVQAGDDGTLTFFRASRLDPRFQFFLEEVERNASEALSLDVNLKRPSFHRFKVFPSDNTEFFDCNGDYVGQCVHATGTYEVSIIMRLEGVWEGSERQWGLKLRIDQLKTHRPANTYCLLDDDDNDDAISYGFVPDDT
jgi:hypothetical protein